MKNKKGSPAYQIFGGIWTSGMLLVWWRGRSLPTFGSVLGSNSYSWCWPWIHPPLLCLYFLEPGSSLTGESSLGLWSPNVAVPQSHLMSFLKTRDLGVTPSQQWIRQHHYPLCCSKDRSSSSDDAVSARHQALPFHAHDTLIHLAYGCHQRTRSQRLGEMGTCPRSCS